MGEAANHNSGGTDSIRHLYVHIPFCARICPYCAFYKELLDRSQTERFCQALLMEVRQHDRGRAISQSPRRFGNRRSLSLARSEEHTSELQSRSDLVCRLLLEKK